MRAQRSRARGSIDSRRPVVSLLRLSSPAIKLSLAIRTNTRTASTTLTAVLLRWPRRRRGSRNSVWIPPVQCSVRIISPVLLPAAMPGHEAEADLLGQTPCAPMGGRLERAHGRRYHRQFLAPADPPWPSAARPALDAREPLVLVTPSPQTHRALGYPRRSAITRSAWPSALSITTRARRPSAGGSRGDRTHHANSTRSPAFTANAACFMQLRRRRSILNSVTEPLMPQPEHRKRNRATP